MKTYRLSKEEIFQWCSIPKEELACKEGLKVKLNGIAVPIANTAAIVLNNGVSINVVTTRITVGTIARTAINAPPGILHVGW